MSEFDHTKIEILQDFKGLTAKELAALSGINTRRLCLIKKGMAEFKEEDADAIHLATGFPTTFFLISEPALPAASMTFRKPSRMRRSDIKRVSSEVSLLSATTARLMQMCGLQEKSSWIDGISPTSTPDGDDIERIAVETRERLGLPSRGPVRNVMWSVERGGVSVSPLSISCAEIDNGAEGVSCPESKCPVIAYSKNGRTGDGIRFTIAHELGHIILQRLRTPSTLRIREEEAHRFAGAFLFPIGDARSVLSPRMNLRDFVDIKAGWGVSISALITRASRMGIIDRDRQRSLMMQMSARGWRAAEPVAVSEEHPVLFKQMVGSTLGDVLSPTHAIASKDAGRFLGRPFDLVDIWADGLDMKENDPIVR